MYSLLKGSPGWNWLSLQPALFKKSFCFHKCCAMIFSLQHLKSGTLLRLLPKPEQIWQPDLFPQTDDTFTGRAIILILFEGSEKRERWHDNLLKYQSESEGRNELPAGKICLIPVGETTREGQESKSKCFAFVVQYSPRGYHSSVDIRQLKPCISDGHSYFCISWVFPESPLCSLLGHHIGADYMHSPCKTRAISMFPLCTYPVFTHPPLLLKGRWETG